MSAELPKEKAGFPLGTPGKYSPGILVSLCLCQFRYKKRVYKQSHLDEKQLAKLHSKVRGRGSHLHCWLRLRYRLPRSGALTEQKALLPGRC